MGVRVQVACAQCGQPRSPSSYRPADGRLLCQACRGFGRPNGHVDAPRAARLSPPDPRMCPQCSVMFQPRRARGGWSETCSKQCGQWRRYGVPPGGHGRGKNARRYERELSRPGLTRNGRKALRLGWIAEGRRCAYCPDLASTVDHILPLHLGGTNYIENLAPACRPCNTSKGRLTLTEWGGRSGHPLSGVRAPVLGEAGFGDVLRGALQEASAAEPGSSR